VTVPVKTTKPPSNITGSFVGVPDQRLAGLPQQIVDDHRLPGFHRRFGGHATTMDQKPSSAEAALVTLPSRLSTKLTCSK
jgi:hypothetical protein